jgi:type II secretory pathway component PulF
MPKVDEARQVNRKPNVARTARRPGSGLGPRLQAAWRRYPLLTVWRLRRRLVFCRGLLSAVKAGLPISTVFDPTWRRTLPSRQCVALARAGKRLREGATLAQALEETRELIDPVTHALLIAGEQSGRLEQLLSRRIAEMEDTRDLVAHVCKLAIYPLYLLGALVLVGPLLSLPGAAASGTSTSELGHVYIVNLLGMLWRLAGGLLMILSLPFWVAALGAEKPVDGMLLRSPVVGALLRDSYGARLCQGLTAGLGGGLEVVRALRLAAQGTASPYVEVRVGAATDRLTQGGTLTDAIAEFGVLDGSSLEQVAMAERTGELENALVVLGRELRDSAARRARLVAFLILGLVVAAVLASVVLKMLGVIFGTISKGYQLPENLDRL